MYRCSSTYIHSQTVPYIVGLHMSWCLFSAHAGFRVERIFTTAGHIKQTLHVAYGTRAKKYQPEQNTSKSACRRFQRIW